MSSIVGGIEIQMAADLARLRRDMADAKTMVGSAATSLQATANTVKAAFGAIGLGLSVAAFGNWIKNAINAADETYNLSQKVGIAAQDLAGLKLAFGQAGIGSDGMQTALVRLSKNVAEGNEAFARMGVSVRANDGTLKTSKQVLYDVADVFAAMPDGINKTALATDVFGKAGADLVPMLNQGSKGMEEMAAMAEKLGLVIDDKTAKAADEFNDTLDLLGKGADGVATQVAAQLLPTLNNLAGSMLKTMASSNFLKNAATGLGWALQALYNVAQIVVAVVKVVGQAFIGLAAGAILMAQGEFRQASVAMSAAWDDMGETIVSTGTDIMDVWDGTAAEAATAGVAITTAQDHIGTSTKAAAEEQKKAAAEASKHAAELLKLRDAGIDLLHSIVEKNAVVQAEIALGRELTAQEKEVIELEKKLKDGKVIMSAAVEEQARAQIGLNAQLEAHRKLQESEKTLAADIAKDKADIIEALGKETVALQDAAEKQREQNLELQLGKEGYTQLTITRLLDLAAEKEQIASTSDQSDELRKQAQALRDRAALLQDGVVLTEARAAADEWAKTTASINDGLTDALFRAFESGKSFGLTLRDSLVNTFKTTVLKPVIQAVMAPITGGIGSLFSGGASAAGGGAGGLGSLGSMIGGLGSLGTIAGTGFGMTMAGGFAGTGAALGSAGAMLSGGATASGLSMGAGALGPYALAALAVYSIAKSLDKSGTPHMGSVVGSDAAGQFSMFGDSSTIMNNFNGDTDAALRSISGLSVGALNGLSAQFGGAANFSSVAKFSADGQDASIGQYMLNQGNRRVGYVGNGSDYAKYSSNAADAYAAFANDIAAATATAVRSINLPKWAKDQFAELGTDATVEEFGLLADSVIATQSALRSLTENVNPLGGIFSKVAGLSSDALFQLTNFAGGIEAFAASTATYVGAYYSEDEKAALSAKSIKDTLRAAGVGSVELSTLSTKDEFRALVESRNLNTSAGRSQLAALLGVSGEFAALADYLAQSGGTLNSTAANAPATQLLENVMSSTMEQSAAVVSGAAETNALMQRLIDAMNTGNTTLLAALSTSTEVQRAVAESGSAAVAVMTRVDNKLGQIESNGSLNNAAPGGLDPNLQT